MVIFGIKSLGAIKLLLYSEYRSAPHRRPQVVQRIFKPIAASKWCIKMNSYSVSHKVTPKYLISGFYGTYTLFNLVSGYGKRDLPFLNNIAWICPPQLAKCDFQTIRTEYLTHNSFVHTSIQCHCPY